MKAASGLANFRRELFLQEVKNTPVWDIIVIGGGATGLGVAVDAAARGFKTLLLEQSDFAKGTSSRSTKLVHGGVRYLAQGDIKLVYEALYERGLLLQNAPHLVNIQSFVIPNYSWWNEMLYGVGLTVYDLMAGKYRLNKTGLLSGKKVKQLLPNINTEGLKGGVRYYDGQFDDARLAINLAQTCAEQGGVVLNYTKVTGLTKDNTGKITGVQAQELESGEIYHLPAKAVVNATGVFVNDILQMNAPATKPLVRPSQGVHVVLDSSFLPGENALMIPKTPDGRVLFVVPWHQHLLVGTTDTPLNQNSLEPTALETEIDFILDTAGKYLVRKPTRADVKSVFAGLRPLAAPTKNTNSTKEISRSHKLIVADSGLITITGGKWTTYRKMAEETVDEAITVAHLPETPCSTANLKIHGYFTEKVKNDSLNIYGSDRAFIRELINYEPALGQTLHPDFPQVQAEVVWAVRNEMARTVEDVLARRLRILFLDARAAMKMAPQVAALMAGELDYDLAWQEKQLLEFTQLAENYLLEPQIPIQPLSTTY
ncbi:glycerol-3-phosphate dehydrogenase/oxidase [Adhaeribacter rhizoryzae]|uniref:Glycerol-3-phosphate dehydrogenase/oxidase n=1 Tax=Adhaeribacter rhizoryzae TaxID=2607907 RepID=A0A5M6DP47_9BACT|nr:glycerol-3-phosphate dehydrogenase/oxidase [Adhaeribacter rhizoryzae]KAA5549311.1 glycerol-3-phosphate dehydrogenase/oxidase [Adhaeribacter rhizoryzae]